MASLIRNLLISKALENNNQGTTKKWVYGITPPSDDSWIKLFPEFYRTEYLPWKKDYGWTDCNKLNPTLNPENPIEDGNLCWAASASNLLHWWFRINKKYIDEYGDRYKGPDYNYPLEKEQESDIFQLFIDSFDNEAGKIDEGLNWFISGKIPSLPPLKPNNNPAGFFKDVFPSSDSSKLLAKNFGGLSKERFNEIIKDALDNKKGIGGVIGDVTSSHAVTFWGAEFDSDGFISAIYMADNNDRDLFESNGVGCVRIEIVYVVLEGTATQTNYKLGYIPDDSKSFPINRIVTLDLGEERWREFLNL